ncbi:hypothetical protein [Peribacillus frigoritolerans]|uniref:hypothetical protein n=1 Tax=Peribacillus frigoritolerans TaxID=450367 RepID=UPI00256FE381|nr:hypothetical protein [Peribacillus frigoritolerans]
MDQNTMDHVRVGISMEKEIIKDKNWIFNDVKKNIKELDNGLIVHTTISNWISQSFDKHKQVVQDEKVVLVDLNLPRNECPIDELECEGKIYPFSKTRLTVNKDSSDDAFITYIFDGGIEKYDLKPLVEECIEILKKDKEFAAIKKRKWPEGFTNEWDKKIFEE